MTLKEKIQALLAAANTATEAGDDDLTSAVATLIAGYNPGGSGTPADDLSDIIGAVTGSTDRAKIAALIAAANEATDEEDDTLKEAFDSLIAGYGQGGGGATWSEITFADSYNTATGIAGMLRGKFKTGRAYFRLVGEPTANRKDHFKYYVLANRPSSGANSYSGSMCKYYNETAGDNEMQWVTPSGTMTCYLYEGDTVEVTTDNIFGE